METREFCKYCDRLNADGKCYVGESFFSIFYGKPYESDQEKYARREWCGWGSIMGVGVITTERGIRIMDTCIKFPRSLSVERLREAVGRKVGRESRESKALKV